MTGSILLHALFVAFIGFDTAGGVGKARAQNAKLEVYLSSPSATDDGSGQELKVQPYEPNEPGLAASMPSRAVPRPHSSKQRELDIDFGLLAYFPVEQLDQRPKVTVDIPIDPADLRELKRGGRAHLTLWINAMGKIDRVGIMDSDMPEEFNRRLVKHFLATEFEPGIKSGVPVPAFLKIEVKVLPLEDGPVRRVAPAN